MRRRRRGFSLGLMAARSPALGVGSRSSAGRRAADAVRGAARARRDDYLVRVAYECRRHRPSARVERGLIRELNRNLALLTLYGFSPLNYQDKPKVKIDNDCKPRTTSLNPCEHGEPQFLPVPDRQAQEQGVLVS